jgi:hypothetical protein
MSKSEEVIVPLNMLEPEKEIAFNFKHAWIETDKVCIISKKK